MLLKLPLSFDTAKTQYGVLALSLIKLLNSTSKFYMQPGNLISNNLIRNVPLFYPFHINIHIGKERVGYMDSSGTLYLSNENMKSL
ncbi:MAG: hypothetical protein ACM3MK_01170, partial [Chitinophagales bacterium]